MIGGRTTQALEAQVSAGMRVLYIRSSPSPSGAAAWMRDTVSGSTVKLQETGGVLAWQEVDLPWAAADPQAFRALAVHAEAVLAEQQDFEIVKALCAEMAEVISLPRAGAGA